MYGTIITKHYGMCTVGTFTFNGNEKKENQMDIMHHILHTVQCMKVYMYSKYMYNIYT